MRQKNGPAARTKGRFAHLKGPEKVGNDAPAELKWSTLASAAPPTQSVPWKKGAAESNNNPLRMSVC
jgi:hypothetical protein